MSVERSYFWLMTLCIVTVVVAGAAYHYGDDSGPLIIVIAVAIMALASWAKAGWDNRPRP